MNYIRSPKWYYEEKSRRSDIVEMLDAVNLPVVKTLKRKKVCLKESKNNGKFANGK